MCTERPAEMRLRLPTIRNLKKTPCNHELTEKGSACRIHLGSTFVRGKTPDQTPTAPGSLHSVSSIQFFQAKCAVLPVGPIAHWIGSLVVRGSDTSSSSYGPADCGAKQRQSFHGKTIAPNSRAASMATSNVRPPPSRCHRLGRFGPYRCAWAQEVHCLEFRQSQSTHRMGTPTLLPHSYHRAELPRQSQARSTRPARSGFRCIYLSFSSSFCRS